VDILGEWLVVEASCDSCVIFEFLGNDTLTIHRIEVNKSKSHYYNLFYNDKVEIEIHNKHETFDVITHSNDIIEIIGLPASNLPEEINTKLKRLYK